MGRYHGRGETVSIIYFGWFKFVEAAVFCMLIKLLLFSFFLKKKKNHKGLLGYAALAFLTQQHF